MFTAVSAPTGSTQSHFAALLDGASETPPNPSLATGRSWAVLDPATNQLFYRVESNVVGGLFAHIHQGAPGVMGPIIFPLTGGPAVYQGNTPALTAAQIQTLWSGSFYFNIHTGAFPGGEIRGQITPGFRRRLAASLDGGQAGTPSPATGTGDIIVRIPENVVTVRLTAVGLGAAPIDAELHTGAPGPPGPLVFALNGPMVTAAGAIWCGTGGPVAPADLTSILAGNAYLTVHTVAFPGGNGEIRGQLKPLVEHFKAHLTQAQENPPTGSANTGFGTLDFDPSTNTATYAVSWTGAGGIFAHIHTGVPGVNGPIIIPLVGPANGPYAGAAVVAAAIVLQLFRSGLYFNIHSGAFPNGEIRGQIVENTDVYGWGGPTSAGLGGRILRIQNIGEPTLGNPAFGLGLSDSLPTSFAALGFAPNLVGAPLDLAFLGAPGHMLWSVSTLGFNTATDSNGCASMFFSLPATPSLVGAEAFFLWVGIDPGANALGVVTSDGLHVTLY